LTFSADAERRRSNYEQWFQKFKDVLAMYPQTSSVVANNSIVTFSDPNCVGNKALYMLLASRTDRYFQRLIRRHDGNGDAALEMLKQQCAPTNSSDKHHYHMRFTTLRILCDESATAFIRRFNYARSCSFSKPSGTATRQ